MLHAMTCTAVTLSEVPDQLTSRLHVLTVTPFYPTAADDAAGCFVAEPLATTAEFGVKNTVVAVRPLHRSMSSARSAGDKVHWRTFFSIPGNVGLPSSGSLLSASLFSYIQCLHRRERIDVIHAHAPLPCGRAAELLSTRLGIPFVVTVHGLDAFCTRQVRGYPGRWCERISRNVYENASQVICVSERVREQVLAGAPRAHTSVVYNGVDAGKFAADKDRDEGHSAILSVGNLIPSKGHELLLKAFAAIAHRYPAVQLDIIGEGCERRRLQGIAAESGLQHRVRFLGRQSRTQVADAMRRCTLFALPSEYEGLGCVYLEAMSSGKPVIG